MNLKTYQKKLFKIKHREDKDSNINEQSIIKLWENIKEPNIHIIITVSKGDKREGETNV